MNNDQQKHRIKNVAKQLKKKTRHGWYLNGEIFWSPAFQSLSKSELKILIALHLMLKWEKAPRPSKPGKRRVPSKMPTNTDDLKLSYRLARELLGFSDNTTARALDGLMEKGFIKRVKVGNFEGGKGRATQYALTEDWRSWVPGMICQKRRKTKGYGYQSRK